MAGERLVIAVQVYPDGGGLGAIVENLVERLSASYEVHLAVVEARAGLHHQLALSHSRVRVCGYSNAINPLMWPTSFAYLARISRFFAAVDREIKPVAVLVQDALNLPTPAVLTWRRSKTAVVVMDHGTLSNTMDSGWLDLVAGRLPPLKRIAFRLGFALDAPWRHARWRIGLRRADAAWFVGDELAKFFRVAGSRSARYKQLLPSDFSAPTDRQREIAREAFKIDLSTTAVNLITRFDGEKGLNLVLDALDCIDVTARDLVLLVAGHGSLESDFKTELELRVPPNKLRWLGKLDRKGVQQVHHASDFHLYAGTIGCAVSIAALEAMRCGVIPLLSSVPSAHRELVGEAGYVFEAGDAQAIADGLLWALSQDPDGRSDRRQRVVAQLEQYAEPSLPTLLAELLTPDHPIA